MNTSAPLVKLTAISKSYRTSVIETVALDKVCLEIGYADFVAVMGPSGCGKSTLLNVIGLVDSPSSGEYLFANQRMSGYSKGQLTRIRRGDVGFVFQSFNLIDDLSVYDNVELPLIYKGVPKRLRKHQVREALELVGLRTRAGHKPTQLSGGQQQRVAVARAIVGDPKLIVADEPTGNLDSKTGDEVMEMLHILNKQGATVLMATHSIQYAEQANRTVRMLDGRVVYEEFSPRREP